MNRKQKIGHDGIVTETPSVLNHFGSKKKLRKYNLKISDSGEILEGPSRSIHMAIPNKAVPNAGSIEQLV